MHPLEDTAEWSPLCKVPRRAGPLQIAQAGTERDELDTYFPDAARHIRKQVAQGDTSSPSTEHGQEETSPAALPHRRTSFGGKQEALAVDLDLVIGGTDCDPDNTDYTQPPRSPKNARIVALPGSQAAPAFFDPQHDPEGEILEQIAAEPTSAPPLQQPEPAQDKARRAGHNSGGKQGHKRRRRQAEDAACRRALEQLEALEPTTEDEKRLQVLLEKPPLWAEDVEWAQAIAKRIAKICTRSRS
ncbi:hypothetical protein JCM3774_004371 [Rhodotorula dairenensis]